MSSAAAFCQTRAPSPPSGEANAAASASAIPLAIFLDQVASIVRKGLPDKVWLAATVVDARAAATGVTLELSDPAVERPATLRVFLPNRSLATIRRDLGTSFDPMLLVGMTTAILTVLRFSPRWHLGGQVEALSPDIAGSLRARQLEQVVATLKREKLWNCQRSLRAPRDVTRLAVVHPVGAAGWGDVAAEFGRWEKAGLVVVRSYQAPFEGDAAATSIAAAVRAAAAPIEGHRPDLILLLRGGGARISLAALDEEIVARAVLGCPVPVICGTGHAQDETLADRVAFRRVDSPSKAMVLVAEMIRGAARGAARDWEAIRGAATMALLTETGQVDTRRRAVLAACARVHGGAERQLTELWAHLEADVRAGSERLLYGATDLDRLLGTVLLEAPRRIDAVERALQTMLQAGLMRAADLLGGSDDGRAAVAQVEARAVALLERQAAALEHYRDGLERATLTLLERTAAALDHALAAADAADPDRMLALGFVLVTDGAGKLLTTRAAASGSARLRLRFGDGLLPVVPAVG